MAKTKSNRVRSPKRYDEDFVKSELMAFIDDALLDDLAELYSLASTNRQVIVHDSATDEASDVFKHGKRIGTAPKESKAAKQKRLQGM